MPEDAALRIEAYTGCLAGGLLGEERTLSYINGRPFTPRLYRNYKAEARLHPDAGRIAAHMYETTEKLLQASGDKFFFVTVRLIQAVERIRLECGELTCIEATRANVTRTWAAREASNHQPRLLQSFGVPV